MRSLKRGIGKRRAVVILEPDALAGLGCLSQARRTQRLSLLRAAVRTLTSGTSISVYIDAGNESWQSPRKIAQRLREVGIGRARGFALNVSNFYFTGDERAYGHRVSALVGGKPFVIDTSRNGRGPTPRHAWCNPPGRGLGQPATSNTGDGLVDAYLWVKLPRRVRRNMPGRTECRQMVASVRARAGSPRRVLEGLARYSSSLGCDARSETADAGSPGNPHYRGD